MDDQVAVRRGEQGETRAWIDQHVGDHPYGVDVVMPVKSVDREQGLSDTKSLGADLRSYISDAHWDYVHKILADHGVTDEPEEENDGSPLAQGVLGWTEATGAPQVGQKVPDFTLADTNGNKVSLGQLLGKGDSPASPSNVTGQASPVGTSTGTPPKAVLLVFYRGYW